MEKFIHFLALFIIFPPLSFAHSVIYDKFSKKTGEEEGEFLIIFYAIDKILLVIHNTHTNVCNEHKQSGIYLCNFSAEMKTVSVENHFQKDP